MNTYVTFFSVIFVNLVSCRDFYVGMFKKNDLLVAQDRLYKEKIPYRFMYAKYGRIFNCTITYFRVADRLGYGPGPKTQIVRGGLRHQYVVLRLTSPYNMPISVNIYVGCANTFTTTQNTRTSTEANTEANTSGTGNPDEENGTNASNTDSTDSTGGTEAETTAAPEE